MLVRNKNKKNGGEQNMKMKKGFTLIELLIVIAIIGILAAVILPSLTGARKRAKESNFIQSMKGYQTSYVLCCDQPTGIIGHPSNRPGQDVCVPTVGTLYPKNVGRNQVFTDMFGGNSKVQSGGQCKYGQFKVQITPTVGAFGDCTGATITQDKVYFQGCKSIASETAP